ncbi:hypothetical protein HK096_000264 [Nowakowskiella sp. JEL0078]|nr:hypothetical protein HK096_000264 [Nowakowskiella sp. JEL0078]
MSAKVYNEDEGFTPTNTNTNLTKEEFAKYLSAAERGDPDSQLFVGWAYQNGIATDKNKSKAALWYRKAAEKGNPKGMFNTGVCYGNGFGIEQDLAKAVEWYRKAADVGHTDAQLSLGWSYENGAGVEVNPELAVSFYKKAADAGNATAQFNLAVCFEEGFGVEEDAIIAMKYYKLAAEKGDTGAAFLLGVAYENGMGVDQDPSHAVFWYEKAAEAGDAGAQFILGVAYESGFGVEPDSEKALEWFTRAAENGYVYANMENIGIEEQEQPQFEFEEQNERDDELRSLPSEGSINDDSDSIKPLPSRKMSRRYSTASWKGLNVDTSSDNRSEHRSSMVGSPAPSSPARSVAESDMDDEETFARYNKRLSTISMSRRSSIAMSISGESMMRRESNATRRPSRAALLFVKMQQEAILKHVEDLKTLNLFFTSNAKSNFQKIIDKRIRPDDAPELFIDILLSFAGIKGSSSYPPESQDRQRFLFKEILSSEMDTLQSYSINTTLFLLQIYYLLKDYQDSKADIYGKLYMLPSHYMLLMDGYWNLDHGFEEIGVCQLTDPSVEADFVDNILLLLLSRQKRLQIVQILQTSLWKSMATDINVDWNWVWVVVLLESGGILDAYLYQNKHVVENKDVVFKMILDACFAETNPNNIKQLLAIPFTPNEEGFLLSYCETVNSVDAKDFLMLYFIDHCRYLEAIKVYEKYFEANIIVDGKENQRIALIENVRLLSQDSTGEQNSFPALADAPLSTMKKQMQSDSVQKLLKKRNSLDEKSLKSKNIELLKWSRNLESLETDFKAKYQQITSAATTTKPSNHMRPPIEDLDSEMEQDDMLEESKNSQQQETTISELPKSPSSPNQSFTFYSSTTSQNTAAKQSQFSVSQQRRTSFMSTTNPFTNTPQSTFLSPTFTNSRKHQEVVAATKPFSKTVSPFLSPIQKSSASATSFIPPLANVSPFRSPTVVIPPLVKPTLISEEVMDSEGSPVRTIQDSDVGTRRLRNTPARMSRATPVNKQAVSRPVVGKPRETQVATKNMATKSKLSARNPPPVKTVAPTSTVATKRKVKEAVSAIESRTATLRKVVKGKGK